MCRRRCHWSALCAASVPVCHFALRAGETSPISDWPQRESHLYNVYLAKLCEQRNKKEGEVEDEEEEPVGPTQVEPAQRNNDEGQDQRQTQRSCKNPCQQTLRFKLEEEEETKMRHVHGFQLMNS